MGKANVDVAMRMLDPAECSSQYVLPNIMARERFQLTKDRVETFDELMEIAVQYFNHHHSQVVCKGVKHPPELARGFVMKILEQSYQGGLEGACRAGRGLGGGLPSVLDCVRDHFMKEQEANYFNEVIMLCVDVMDLDDIKSLMEQYVRQYGRYIDGENMPKAEYLVPKYREVLKSHSKIVEHTRMQFGR
jgi:hypothetical protein